MSLRGRRYDPVKRVLDVLGAAVLLLLTSPLLLVVALSVAGRLGRPVLFRQARPGRHDEIFTLVKFRSMRDSDPSRGLESDEARLTPFGRILRSTSVDELPTLLNVLRGDMSLVGPRPLLVSYLDRYSVTQRRRHEVRPGITGLAQVSGRNDLGWDEKIRLDVEYVDSRSLRLDLAVLRRTAASVVKREGISARGHATAPEFLGIQKATDT